MEIPHEYDTDYNAGRSAFTCDLRAEEGLDDFPSLAYFDEACAWGVRAAEQSYWEGGEDDVVTRRLWFLAGWMWAWYERFNDPSEEQARERLRESDRAWGLFSLVRESGQDLVPFAVTRPCDYLAWLLAAARWEEQRGDRVDAMGVGAAAGGSGAAPDQDGSAAHSRTAARYLAVAVELALLGIRPRETEQIARRS